MGSACCSPCGKSEEEQVTEAEIPLITSELISLKLEIPPSPPTEATELTERTIEGEKIEKVGEELPKITVTTDKAQPKQDTASQAVKEKETYPPAELDEVGRANLIYDSKNEGTFYIAWRKQPIPNALAFAQPGENIQIPPFKYRGQSELARGLHTNKKIACQGFLQFLRSVKPFQVQLNVFGSLKAELSRVPEVLLIVHYDNDTIKIVEPGVWFDMTVVDFAVAVLSNTTAAENLSSFVTQQGKADVKTLLARCKQYPEHVDYISLAGRSP